MKQRLTYILKDPSSFNPEQILVGDDSITTRRLRAAKEQHVTIGLDELPQEVARALRQCHELHIRWGTTQPYDSTPPFSSRVSPGLHVFFTPLRDRTASLLCPALRKVFGPELACTSPKESFTPVPVSSGRFSSSSSLAYHRYLPSLVYLTDYLAETACSKASTKERCIVTSRQILSAQYLDIDFDTISNALIIKAFWADSPSSGWEETSRLPSGAGSLEVGVLNIEKPDEDEPDSLKLGGFLTRVGSDSSPKETLFSFPARFHPLSPSTKPATYTVEFGRPTGLHPNLRITLPQAPSSPQHDRACALHTYLTLPSWLFIDQYQFADPLFLASNRLVALRSLSGATDLEAPDWIVDQWGSSALFELASRKTPDAQGGSWDITIPLHLRYLEPSNSTAGLVQKTMPWPVVFWACEAEDGLKFPTSPFDRVNLGYESLFGPKTMFYHLSPAPAQSAGRTATYEHAGTGSGCVESITVPTLDLGNRWSAWLDQGTLFSIALGVAWIVWCLFRPLPNRAVSQARKKI